MEKRSAWLLGALGASALLWVLSRTQGGQAVTAGAADFVGTLVGWSPPSAATPYLPAIERAEQTNGLPRNLLARMAYQESRFRADIISGQTKSSAGAVGILQIVPKWHPKVDPYDPFASIDYAARWMRDLHRRLGDWKLALAAYNAGEANVKKHGGVPPFAETQAYVRDIARDVGLV